MASQSSHLAYAVLVAVFLVMFLPIAPAMAAMTLSGVKYMADVTPGATVTFPMTLSSADADAAEDYEVTVIGFGNSPNGNYLGIDPAQDTGPYTARPFITLDKTAVHIPPGGKEVITATMQVPSGGAGGLYALINIRPKPVAATGAGSSFTTAMNVPIMITLKGTQLTETGTIESVSISDAMQGKSLEVTTVFTSSGNHHYYGAKNEIAVTDSTGKEVVRTATAPSVTAIVPGGKVNFRQQITAALSPGTYTVDSNVFDSKGTVLDTKTVSFTVGGPSTPAPTPAVSEAPTHVVTEAPTQAMSEVPTAPMTVVKTEEAPLAPGAIATRAPLSAITIMLALAAVCGILVLRRKG